MITPERITRVLDANPISRVAEKLGIETHTRGRNLVVNKCPFCGEENVAVISPRFGVFKCFRCNESAGPAMLVSHVKKYTFEQAINFLDTENESAR